MTTATHTTPEFAKAFTMTESQHGHQCAACRDCAIEAMTYAQALGSTGGTVNHNDEHYAVVTRVLVVPA